MLYIWIKPLSLPQMIRIQILIGSNFYGHGKLSLFHPIKCPSIHIQFTVCYHFLFSAMEFHQKASICNSVL